MWTGRIWQGVLLRVPVGEGSRERVRACKERASVLLVGLPHSHRLAIFLAFFVRRIRLDGRFACCGCSSLFCVNIYVCEPWFMSHVGGYRVCELFL